jgi:PKD repeat protein
MIKKVLATCVSIILCLLSFDAQAQCPTLYDFFGVPNGAPYWYDCTGNDFNLVVQSPDNIGNWTIDWGDGSPIDNGASLIPPATITHLYTATVDTFVVTFTEPGTGCVITGVFVMEEATSASLQVPIGGLTQICAPNALDFINSSTNVSQTTVFTWDFGDGSPLEVYDYTNWGQTVSHTYLPGTVNCETQVTLTGENYCNTLQGGNSTATFNPIRIWDIDDAAIQASATLLCYPDTTVDFLNVTNRNCLFQGNIAQRYEYWNFGDYWGLGQDSIVDWTPWPPTFPYTIAYPGIGIYNVMLIDSNFCGLDTAYITIQIVPPPTAALTASDDTICSGDAVTFFNGSTGGANEFFWNFGDGTGWQNLGAGDQTYTYFTPGDYTILLVANINGGTASCTDTVTIPLHVLPSPAAVINLDNDVGCDSLTVNFFDASVDAVTWFWDFGNGNTSTLQNPPAQTYIGANQYTVTLMVTSLNGCTNTDTDLINIYQSPVVSFLPTSVCQNELAQFTDFSSSSPGDPILTWSWDFDDGNTSTLQNPTNTYLTIGTFNVVLAIATANCAATDTVPITVDPIPNAGFTPSANSGCTDLPVDFTNTSTGAASYFWDFGDGDTSILTDPSHLFTNPYTFDTTYTVMLVALTTFGCSDTAYDFITVYPTVQANFTHNGLPGCAPLAVDFVNLSTGGFLYLWDFGDGNGSTAMSPSYTYINTTLFIEIYDVELVVTSTNGCTDTTVQQIIVYPIPEFGFTAQPDTGCSPITITFPSVIGAVSYNWDFGDGGIGTGPTPTHTYVNSSTNTLTYDVTLIAISAFGCIDTTTSPVVIYPNPTAQFVPVITAGCSPFSASFQNSSLGAVTYLWDYGDGTTSDTLIALHQHVFYNTTNASVFYDVFLTAYTVDGCADTMTQTIEVYPEVIAAFTSDTIGCSPLIIDFTNTSLLATTYNWDFGDGFVDIVQDPTHTFTNLTAVDVIYTVELIATSVNGCTDTAYIQITVTPTPTAAFAATPVNQVYPAATVNITNLSGAGTWDYQWDLGDGVTTSLQNPGSHIYATWGTYTITLIVSNAFCSDTVAQNIVIDPPIPLADFIGSGAGCAPLTVSFTDQSEWVDTWEWDFGDGTNTAFTQNPTHTYYIAGTYSVTLTVTGPGGQDVLIKIDSVVVYDRANAFFGAEPEEVFIPNQPVTFFNFSTNADTYSWDFGDGETSTDENPQHYYTSEGSYTVMLIASNALGCPDTFYVPNAVTAIAGGDIVFPNAFTPNPGGGNGGQYDPNSVTNDVFFPVFNGVTDYHMMIFTRWGELIFESFDTAVGWDGFYREEACQQEVYVWKVDGKFSDGSRFSQAGDVTLLR